MQRESWHPTIGFLAGGLALPVVLWAGQTITGPARLSGDWVLNRQQSTSVGRGSDAVPESNGPRRGGFSGGFGGPGGIGRGIGGGPENRETTERQRALMRELLEPLPRITVTTDNVSVTFTASDGRVRKYRIDGRKEKHQFDNGTVDTKSKWERQQLVIETSTSGGMKLVETYSVNDLDQLVIEARVDTGRGGARPPIVHVYDDASALE
jgi:hypothetical protein